MNLVPLSPNPIKHLVWPTSALISLTWPVRAWNKLKLSTFKPCCPRCFLEGFEGCLLFFCCAKTDLPAQTTLQTSNQLCPPGAKDFPRESFWCLLLEGLVWCTRNYFLIQAACTYRWYMCSVHKFVHWGYWGLCNKAVILWSPSLLHAMQICPPNPGCEHIPQPRLKDPSLSRLCKFILFDSGHLEPWCQQIRRCIWRWELRTATTCNNTLSWNKLHVPIGLHHIQATLTRVYCKV